MAKSFKQLSPPGRAFSEQDFFDLTEAANGSASLVDPTPPAPVPATGQVLDTAADVVPAPLVTPSVVEQPTGAASRSRSPRSRVQPVTAPQPVPVEPAATLAAEEPGVRQTIIVGASYLERLRDVVHSRRAGGDYCYSQRQAIQEALTLFFNQEGPVAARPSEVHAREAQQRDRIRQARRAATSDAALPGS